METLWADSEKRSPIQEQLARNREDDFKQKDQFRYTLKKGEQEHIWKVCNDYDHSIGRMGFGGKFGIMAKFNVMVDIYIITKCASGFQEASMESN